MVIFAFSTVKQSRRNHPNKAAIAWAKGCAVMAFLARAWGLPAYLGSCELLHPRHSSYRCARPLGLLRCLRHDRDGHHLLRLATTARQTMLKPNGTKKWKLLLFG